MRFQAENFDNASGGFLKVQAGFHHFGVVQYQQGIRRQLFVDLPVSGFGYGSLFVDEQFGRVTFGQRIGSNPFGRQVIRVVVNGNVFDVHRREGRAEMIRMEGSRANQSGELRWEGGLYY
jgi:hypothetical protein